MDHVSASTRGRRRPRRCKLAHATVSVKHYSTSWLFWLRVQKPGENPIWDNSLLSTVGAGHDVRFLDRDRPIEPQFDGVHGVIMMGAEPTPVEWFEAARGAKFWQLLSVGYDKFDVEAIRNVRIPCCNCPGSTSAPGLAESAIMMIYLVLKRWNEAQEVLAQGKAFNPMGEDIGDRLMGFVGFGASGLETARLATAIGLRVAISEPLEIKQALLDEYQPEFVVRPPAAAPGSRSIMPTASRPANRYSIVLTSD